MPSPRAAPIEFFQFSTRRESCSQSTCSRHLQFEFLTPEKLLSFEVISTAAFRLLKYRQHQDGIISRQFRVQLFAPNAIFMYIPLHCTCYGSNSQKNVLQFYRKISVSTETSQREISQIHRKTQTNCCVQPNKASYDAAPILPQKAHMTIIPTSLTEEITCSLVFTLPDVLTGRVCTENIVLLQFCLVCGKSISVGSQARYYGNEILLLKNTWNIVPYSETLPTRAQVKCLATCVHGCHAPFC